MFEEIIVDNEADWFNIRSSVLTATEIAVILGLNNYRSVTEMIKDKTENHRFENAYTWIGIQLEPIVVAATNKVLGSDFKLFEEIKDSKSFFLDRELKLGSTPDARDATRLLECKSTKPVNYFKWSGWPPAYYLSQLYTQLICTEKQEGLLAVLSTNLSQKSEELKLPIHIFQLNRDSKLDSIIISEVRRFWKTIADSKVFRVNRKQTLEVELRLRIKCKRIY